MRGVITENMNCFPIHCLGHKEVVNSRGIQSPRLVIAFEDIIKCSFFAIADHLACSEVHRTAHSAVNTAQIQHQLTVNVEPEVIVAGKFEDNVVSPVIHAVGSLGKYSGKFHTEIVISIILRDRIQRLALARICVRELISSDIAKISDHIAVEIVGVAILGADIVIGHELAMDPGITCISSDRAKLIVNCKVSDILSFCVIMREVLGTVVFEISAFIIYTLNEQVIGRRQLRFVKKSCKTAAFHLGICCDRRIPVYQVGGDQSCFRLICVSRIPLASAQISRLYGVTIALDTIIEIDHLNADAEIVVIHCSYFRGRICFLDRRRDHREVEIVGLIE